MWIMTPDGILMPAAVPTELDGYAFNEDDWDMQVRARDRKVLVKTRKAMIKRPFVVVSRIVETLDRDYEYRMYVHASDFAEYVADLVRAIDYEKFKPVSLKRGRGGESLHNLYNRIWGVVATHYDSPILGRYARASRRSSRKDFE